MSSAGPTVTARPRLHPGFTQEVAPDESQSAPKPMRGEAVIYDVLFVALWLEDLNLLRVVSWSSSSTVFVKATR